MEDEGAEAAAEEEGEFTEESFEAVGRTRISLDKSLKDKMALQKVPVKHLIPRESTFSQSLLCHVRQTTPEPIQSLVSLMQHTNRHTDRLGHMQVGDGLLHRVQGCLGNIRQTLVNLATVTAPKNCVQDVQVRGNLQGHPGTVPKIGEKGPRN